MHITPEKKKAAAQAKTKKKPAKPLAKKNSPKPIRKIYTREEARLRNIERANRRNQKLHEEERKRAIEEGRDVPDGEGRPPKWVAPSLMQKAIDAFFAECEAQKRPITITGLALALDLTRQGLNEYEKKAEFSDTIRKAKLRVTKFYEEKLTLAHASGSMFALTNLDRDHWKNRQTHEGGAPEDPIQTHMVVKFVRPEPPK